MRYLFSLLTFFFILESCGEKNTIVKNDKTETDKEATKIYEIIQKTYYPKPEENDSTEIPGVIDSLAISKLNEPLKALTAFYSAMGGSMCSGEYCDLTSALGLGKQGSEQHKKLIEKYFPRDKVAATVIKQDCYLRQSGASTFSDYEYLIIKDIGDTVEVDYNLMYYNRGDIEWTKGPDLYVFSDNKFTKIKRNLWGHVEK
jgi:hypothetical protein